MLDLEVCLENFCIDYYFKLDEKTLKAYKKAVEQLFEHSEKSFRDITARDIRKWLIGLERNGYKPSTLKVKVYGVKLFYEYCLEEKILSINPAASVLVPKVEDSLPYYLEINQLNQLRKLVEEYPRERAITEILYTTGMRLSELFKLKLEDVKWEERMIYIQEGKLKKGRIVLFTRRCEEYLRAYLETRNDNLPYLFVNSYGTRQMCTGTISQKFDRYEKELGFHLTPHTLRHTFAAHLAMKGMPLECLQSLLGHDNPHNTQLYARLYSHARKDLYDQWM